MNKKLSKLILLCLLLAMAFTLVTPAAFAEGEETPITQTEPNPNPAPAPAAPTTPEQPTDPTTPTTPNEPGMGGQENQGAPAEPDKEETKNPGENDGDPDTEVQPAALNDAAVQANPSTDGGATSECKHEKTTTITTPATCEANGSEKIVCTKCDAVLSQKDIPALGHDMPENWTVVTKPTCKAKGSAERDCSRGDKRETKELPMLEHEVAKWKTIKEPTCTESGYKEGPCTSCGETILKTVPALGHDLAAKCEGMWNHTIYCQREKCEFKYVEGHNYCHWHKLDKQSDSKTVTWQRVCDDCGWAETWTQDVAASPRTGDGNNVVVYSLICALTLCAAGASALLLKKKENG